MLFSLEAENSPYVQKNGKETRTVTSGKKIAAVLEIQKLSGSLTHFSDFYKAIAKLICIPFQTPYSHYIVITCCHYCTRILLKEGLSVKKKSSFQICYTKTYLVNTLYPNKSYKFVLFSAILLKLPRIKGIFHSSFWGSQMSLKQLNWNWTYISHLDSAHLQNSNISVKDKILFIIGIFYDEAKGKKTQTQLKILW